MSWARLLAMIVALGLAASCRTTDANLPPHLDGACQFPEGRTNFVDFSTPVFRQGSNVSIRAKRDNMPFGYLDIPIRCTSHWTVSGPAALSADRGTLAISPAAPPGAEVVLQFRVMGEPVVSRFQVIGRDAVVLTGRWGQSAIAGCEGLAPVRELEFGPERFAVTFTPFETYKDYWGSYRFDPATGAIQLTVTGGNSIPAGLDLEGIARLEGGHLVLEQMYLGDPRSPQPQGGCRYTF